MMYRTFYILMLSFVLSTPLAAQKPGRIYMTTEVLDGEEAEVKRLFPGRSVKHADPFILLDEFNVSLPLGFPTHKHSGFEAITYMIEGSFVHKDNLGNNDTIYAGQAQRFTAGSGLEHSEMPGGEGINKGLQLWLNIPSDAKASDPAYQFVETLPVQSTDSTAIIRTIVGEGSPLEVQCGCDLSYVDVQLKNNAVVFSPKHGYTSFVYVIDGAIEIKNTVMNAGEFYFLESGIIHKIIGGTDVRFVYLSAKPLNQRIRQRGPYVY